MTPQPPPFLPSAILTLSILSAAAYTTKITTKTKTKTSSKQQQQQQQQQQPSSLSLSLSRAATKTLSTSLLALFAHLRSSPRALVVALALGSLGDAFLAFDSGSSDDAAFLRGLASFLVAHLFYIYLFVSQQYQDQDQDQGQDLFIFISRLREILSKATSQQPISLVLVFSVVALLAVLLPRVAGPLRAPVAVYSLVILIMGIAAVGLSESITGVGLESAAGLESSTDGGGCGTGTGTGTAVSDVKRILTGALLFTASDAILATGRFLVAPESSLQAWMQPAVWVLYYSGQMLITLWF